jgi:DNA-binding NtrC family response regulator
MSARRLLFIQFEDDQLAAGSAALRQAGYRVEGAKSLLGALRWLSYDNFDLIVIGDTVLKSQLALVLERIHENTRSPVILICGGDLPFGVVVDAMVRLEDGEAALVGAVDRLLLNAPNHFSQRPDPSGTSLA